MKRLVQSALLQEQELEYCQQIASRRTIHGKRAIALLAVHEGQTQAQAAAESGLTPGGVRYWIAKFREQRLGIFPPASGSTTDGDAPPKPPAKAKSSEAKDEAPKSNNKKKSKKKNNKRSKGAKKRSKKGEKGSGRRRKDKRDGKKSKKDKKPKGHKGKRLKKGKKSTR